MINILVTILVGFFVGVLARFFYPGPVHMSWLWTILLGIGGSLLAGLVTHRGQSAFTAPASLPRSSARWCSS